MSDITKVDKNFAIESDLKLSDAVFYDVKENDFCLYGVFYDDGAYRRLPEAVAKSVNEGVHFLHANTSGGRLRFITDSPYVAISATMPDQARFSHFAYTGSTGFDLYVDGVYHNTFIPPCPLGREGYDSVLWLLGEGEREITIHFPLYHNVNDLRIGLKEGASFRAAAPYKTGKRVCFYGSSITQGGCVSRPGGAYPNLIAMKLSTDIVNLGFSGSARAEKTICDYIAALDMDVFVMDYDHNAPNAEYLQKTHEPFFRAIRAARPEMPILILSAPNVRFKGALMEERREIVRATYEHAVKDGDQNVYYIDGATLFGEEGWDNCTVDACHPNDLGHYRMAETVAAVLAKLL